MTPFVNLIEEIAIGMLMATLDLAKQDLSEMDNIADDDLDIVPFNGREFLRESIELVEGLVWALSCRNQKVFAYSVGAIAETWTVWEKKVIASDDPPWEVEKAALEILKRLRKSAVKYPESPTSGQGNGR